ncbi:hypothetical protein EDM00_04245 [Ornithobacterium rhinotracheale]|uniref:hypothetical protein n=1 Tax=Ornithobacterium rhinotracheale TaxID=28251 RepID=UPI00129C4073|nr:hypothetical protein [Ornithobacterium rhinotracheale]MRI63205.1 hypothetical protein [Ornithobacterium rhinotracheale]
MAVVIFVFLWLRNKENDNYKNQGEELINKIEIFRSEHNRLPNSVNELGLVEPMNEGPYYEKKDSLSYIIYFNIGFDNTKTYSSKTKKWQDTP